MRIYQRSHPPASTDEAPAFQCACCADADQPASAGRPAAGTHRTGCLVCGAELVYFPTGCAQSCHYCGAETTANAACAAGHFVCDACHRADAVEIIRILCQGSRLRDPVLLMQSIRAHPSFSIHGPEHHALVPAVLLTALRNCGQPITDDQLESAIQRGQMIGGGACGFLGVCGAAAGVGIAVSVLLGATPYLGERRQAAQRATLAAMESIADYAAPRCCQRESWLVLQAAAGVIEQHMGVRLSVDPFACDQHAKNKECIHNRCPLWKVS